MNVILYCRVSSDEQTENCSLEMQEQFLKIIAQNTTIMLLMCIEKITPQNILICEDLK